MNKTPSIGMQIMLHNREIIKIGNEAYFWDGVTPVPTY